MTATGRTTVAQQGGVENFVDDGRARSSATKKDEDEEGKALDFLFRPPGGLWAAATKACVRWIGRAKWAWASGGKAPRADCSGGAFV